MIDYIKAIPFIQDSFANMSDSTNIRVLSDFLRDNDDFRGWLLAIPLFVIDHKYNEKEVKLASKKTIPSFKQIHQYTKCEYQHTQLYRRISALFGVGLVLQFTHVSMTSKLGDDLIEPRLLDGSSSNLRRSLYQFAAIPADKVPKLVDVIREFLYRMWFYNAGLLSLEDRDYDYVDYRSYRRVRTVNHLNCMKLEWAYLDYDRVSLLRSPEADVHIKIARSVNSICDLFAHHQNTASQLNFDTSLFTYKALYKVTADFLSSDLLRDMIQNFSLFFQQRAAYKQLRHGKAHIFV